LSAERWALAGDVITMDPARPRGRVVVLEGGRIVEVGGEELLAQVREAGLRVEDTGGRAILPGFVDPHAHAEIAARALIEMVDCRAPECRTVADVLDRLRDNLWRAEESGWLVAQGNLFLDQKLQDKRLPTREELDSVSRDVAIVLRAGGHTSVLNSKGFDLSDVVRYAGAEGMMGGAVIETDSSGRPTGVISELDKVLPLPQPDTDALRQRIRDGARELFTKFGVTSVGEISESLAGLHLMDDLVRTGELPIRFSVLLWTPGTMSFEDALDWERHLTLTSAPAHMHVRGIKMFADGGYSARNAAARTPYVEKYAVEKGSRGQVNLSSARVQDAVRRTREVGLQLAVHANGERAQDEVCAGVAAAGVIDDPALQTRIEHAGNLVTTQATVDAWRSANILPIPQPVFLYNFGDFIPVYLGEPGRHGRFPFRKLLDDGWKLSGSSDVLLGSETRQTNPLFSVWCCLKRQTFLGEQIDPEQRITLDEALEMHTINGALALGQAHERGSIAPGKLADLVVLAESPYDVDVDRLPEIEVDSVFVDGRLAYERPQAAGHNPR
jgi:predicted amidohydrolase YtcJ